MSFKEQMKVDATAVFTNSGEFAEKIIYFSNGDGPGKVINAVVNRHLSKPAAENNLRISINEVEIQISKDSIVGIPSVRKTKDRAIVPDYEGGPQSLSTLVEILESDPGMWKLLFRK